MARERDRRKIVWPSYFDVRLSRAAGRRLPKALCVENPDLERVVEAAKALKLRYEVESEKAFPALWWRREGRILVESDKSKTELLLTLGRQLKRA